MRFYHRRTRPTSLLARRVHTHTHAALGRDGLRWLISVFQWRRTHMELLAKPIPSHPIMCVCECTTILTRLSKLIWQQAASPLLVADLLIADAHNRSTVFARWRQYACLSNHDSWGSLHSLNGSSIDLFVFAPVLYLLKNCLFS